MNDTKIDRVLNFFKALDGGDYSPDARRKPFWHRDNFSRFLRGDDFHVTPVTVEFWPSAQCNARCRLCPYRLNGARKDADLAAGSMEQGNPFFADPAVARHVARECKKLGVLSFLVTGGGEPFMNPDVDGIARAFVEQGLAMGVYTNGTVAKREKAIQAVAELQPRFVRISVNAGNAAEHLREYGVPWGWRTLGDNARLWARVLPPETSLSFSWVLTGQEPEATYVGAAQFLLDLHRDTGRPIAGHFRPKYAYYQHDGSVHNPGALNFDDIPRKVDDHVRPAVADAAGIDIQVNTYAVAISKADPFPQSSFATGWAASFTHTAKGYITSELNGSTWPDTSWGTLEPGVDLVSLWLGKERERLWRLYQNEPRLPPYHKLTGLTNVLKDLRAIYLEPFTDAEIACFWHRFDDAGFTKPLNWDFI